MPNRHVQTHLATIDRGNLAQIGKRGLAIGTAVGWKAGVAVPGTARISLRESWPEVLSHHHPLANAETGSIGHTNLATARGNRLIHFRKLIAAVYPALVPAANRLAESKQAFVIVVRRVVAGRHLDAGEIAARTHHRHIAVIDCH